MKIIILISAIITMLVVLSTMICGLWIQANNLTDQSALDFHKTIGIVSAICCVVTFILVIAYTLRT